MTVRLVVQLTHEPAHGQAGRDFRRFPHRTALIDAVFQLQEEANALIAPADELTDADDPFSPATQADAF